MPCQTGWGISAIALVALLSLAGCKHQIRDPRADPPMVALAQVQPAQAGELGFTGIVAARVQSDLGFRVSGKIVERLVGRGQAVHAGQALMRLDPVDFDNAVTVQAAAVAAAQANLVQAQADARRDTTLVGSGSVSQQTYIDATSAADGAHAQLDAAQAQLKIARDNRGYATLVADSDGVVADYLADPGQVITAGQTVIVLAKAGPREALVDLPEDVRPAIGSAARAMLFSDNAEQQPATLRELSDAADPATRTFTARYILQGGMAQALLGATVTVYLTPAGPTTAVNIPIAAVYDPGSGPGVWLYDKASSTVSFQPVRETVVGDETITVNSGVRTGQVVVAMGANLLHDGEKVRIAPDQGQAP
jgi:RND family efflux transporter MFP subunit